MIRIAQETIEIEGIITKIFHDPSKHKSEIIIKTDTNKEYSFQLQSPFPFSDIMEILTGGKRLKIKGIIDKNNNKIIGIQEVWVKIELT